MLATQSRLSTPKESAPQFTGATVTRAEYFERPPCPCSAPVRPYAPALFVVLHNQRMTSRHRTRFWNLRQSIGNDLHQRPEWNLTVKHGNVGGFHSDATVARRTPDCLFFRRAVDVDAAVKSLRVLGFKSAQPNDPRSHRIAARSIWLENFAGQPPIVEDGADWRVVADFLRDHKVAERRRHSPSKIP